MADILGIGKSKLAKMTLQAFDNPDCTTPKAGLDIFTVQVNPESYAVNYSINYGNQGQAPTGASANQVQAARMDEESISFDFLFDATGALKDSAIPIALPLPGGGNENDIVKQIVHFKDVVFKYDGNKHEPNYVQIIWGTLLFKCRLQTMNISYKLFKPDGTPLRAKASCTFLGTVDETMQVLKNSPKSPDLTHIRVVTDGDTLPLMAHRIYGDATLYLEVARFNNLRNFRDLKPGQEIYFPPIDKGS